MKTVRDKYPDYITYEIRCRCCGALNERVIFTKKDLPQFTFKNTIDYFMAKAEKGFVIDNCQGLAVITEVRLKNGKTLKTKTYNESCGDWVVHDVLRLIIPENFFSVI